MNYRASFYDHWMVSYCVKTVEMILTNQFFSIFIYKKCQNCQFQHFFFAFLHIKTLEITVLAFFIAFLHINMLKLTTLAYFCIFSSKNTHLLLEPGLQVYPRGLTGLRTNTGPQLT